MSIKDHGGQFGGGVLVDFNDSALRLEKTLTSSLYNASFVGYNGEEDGIAFFPFNNTTGATYVVYGLDLTGFWQASTNLNSTIAGLVRRGNNLYVLTYNRLYKYQFTRNNLMTKVWEYGFPTNDTRNLSVSLDESYIAVCRGDNQSGVTLISGTGQLLRNIQTQAGTFTGSSTFDSEGFLYHSKNGGAIYKHNPSTGQMIWESTGMNPSGAVISRILVFKNHIYVSVSSSYGYKLRISDGFKVETLVDLTGTTRFSFDAKGNLYLTNSNGVMLRGKETFSTPTAYKSVLAINGVFDTIFSKHGAYILDGSSKCYYASIFYKVK